MSPLIQHWTAWHLSHPRWLGWRALAAKGRSEQALKPTSAWPWRSVFMRTRSPARKKFWWFQSSCRWRKKLSVFGSAIGVRKRRGLTVPLLLPPKHQCIAHGWFPPRDPLNLRSCHRCTTAWIWQACLPPVWSTDLHHQSHRPLIVDTPQLAANLGLALLQAHDSGGIVLHFFTEGSGISPSDQPLLQSSVTVMHCTDAQWGWTIENMHISGTTFSANDLQILQRQYKHCSIVAKLQWIGWYTAFNVLSSLPIKANEALNPHLLPFWSISIGLNMLQ